MNSYIYLLCILFPLIMLWLGEKRDEKIIITRKINKKRNKEGRLEMVEFAKQFIGKECLIYTFNSQVTGTIKEVSDSAMLIESNKNTEVINLDYVVRIREYPTGKNGKKKSVVLD